MFLYSKWLLKGERDGFIQAVAAIVVLFARGISLETSMTVIFKKLQR